MWGIKDRSSSNPTLIPIRSGFGLILMFMLLIHLNLAAQSTGSPVDEASGNTGTTAKKIAGELYLPLQGHIRGTPFLNERWMPGIVVFQGGDSTWISSMNYNAYLDEVIYVNQVLNMQVIIDHLTLEGFILTPGDGKPDLRFNRWISTKNARSKYVQVLVKERISLLVVRKTDLIIDQGYPPALHPDYFLPNDKYYVVQQDSILLRFKPSIAQLSRLFPEWKKEIKQYVKQQRLNVSDEPDLIQVFHYLNGVGNP